MFNHLPVATKSKNPSVRLREQQAQDLQQRRLREDLKVALEAPKGSWVKGIRFIQKIVVETRNDHW